jgi:small subunit ribosomal protein S16
VIETIGKYHPKADPSYIEVDSERARYWLGVGAQPTEPVAAILKLTGDWQAHKGLPAPTEGIRTAAPAPDRKAVFEAAAKETHDDAPAKKTAAKKAPAKKAAQAETTAAAEAPGDEPAAGEEPAAEAAAEAPPAPEATASEAPTADETPAPEAGAAEEPAAEPAAE